MGRSNNNLNEKRLGASHGSKRILSDTAAGSPVTEIGYNQFFKIAVPEKVDMVTYQ